VLLSGDRELLRDRMDADDRRADSGYLDPLFAFYERLAAEPGVTEIDAGQSPAAVNDAVLRAVETSEALPDA
jgi:hypothetical protein